MNDLSKKPQDDAAPQAFCMTGEPSESSFSSPVTSKRARRQKNIDCLFFQVTRFFAFLVLALLGGIVISLFIGACPAIKQFGLHFFVSSEWDPNAKIFGALVPIYGTLVSSIIALILAVPISFGIAFFLTELCPNFLRRPFGIAIELLAGIPSIIYGMWGLFVFAPFFANNVQPWLMERHFDNVNVPFIGPFISWAYNGIFTDWLFQGMPIGLGLFTAGLVLAIMIIPFTTSVMRDVFETVPNILKESAYGLGATKWEVVRRVVLPYTRIGVVGGIMLGLGRALGETMAVTFIIGNSNIFKPGLFQPGNSIASIIANEFAEASGELHLAALMELGLLLFIITFVVLAAAKMLLLRLERNEGQN